MPTAYPGRPAYTSYQNTAPQGPIAWTPPPTDMSWDNISVINVAHDEGYKQTGNPSPSFNSGAMGINHYLSNVWQAQMEIIKQQEGIPRPTPTDTPDFEFATTPPGGGDVIRNPSPDEGFWGQRFDPSLLLPSGWMDAVYRYLAEKEAEKPGGSVPVNTANALRDGGSKVTNAGKAVGEVGKDAVDVVNSIADPDPSNPYAWLMDNIGIVALAGGFVLLIVLIK